MGTCWLSPQMRETSSSWTGDLYMQIASLPASGGDWKSCSCTFLPKSISTTIPAGMGGSGLCSNMRVGGRPALSVLFSAARMCYMSLLTMLLCGVLICKTFASQRSCQTRCATRLLSNFSAIAQAKIQYN